MPRKGRTDRIHEIILLNPALHRDDTRIDQLIRAEALLRKAQRAAQKAPITVPTGTGSKRSPEWVAVDSAETSVRRLRNELNIDRRSVKRSEAAGVKVKRSTRADTIIRDSAGGYIEAAELIPNLAATWAAYGIVPEDLPLDQRERFRNDLEEQTGYVSSIREAMRSKNML